MQTVKAWRGKLELRAPRIVPKHTHTHTHTHTHIRARWSYCHGSDARFSSINPLFASEKEARGFIQRTTSQSRYSLFLLLLNLMNKGTREKASLIYFMTQQNYHTFSPDRFHRWAQVQNPLIAAIALESRHAPTAAARLLFFRRM